MFYGIRKWMRSTIFATAFRIAFAIADEITLSSLLIRGSSAFTRLFQPKIPLTQFLDLEMWSIMPVMPFIKPHMDIIGKKTFRP